MAQREDEIDLVRAVMDELRADLADGVGLDGERLLEHLEAALGPG